MQTLDEIDAHSTCKQILGLDDGIYYSSLVDSAGSIVSEAIRDSIVTNDRLSIMILPLKSTNESVVVATSIYSNLAAIVEKTKSLF
jgi:hypothetical protein